MSCAYCNDTGSLSRDLDGPLDCARCGIADERADLEAWAAQQRIPYGSETSIWMIYQHGKAAAAAK